MEMEDPYSSRSALPYFEMFDLIITRDKKEREREKRLLKQAHKLDIKRPGMDLMMCLEIKAIKHLMQAPPVGKKLLNESIRQALFSVPGHKWSLICIKCLSRQTSTLKKKKKEGCM